MKFSIGIANDKKPSLALEKAVSEAMKGLGGLCPHLGIIFITPHYHSIFSSLGKKIHHLSQVETFLGCTAEGIIAGDREYDSLPGICVWLAHLPGVELTTLHMEYAEREFSGWLSPEELMSRRRDIILLGDPYTFPVDLLLQEINEQNACSIAVGGMASGGARPYENYLFLGEENFQSGGLALLIDGDIELDAVVSQGCRPIGKYFVITKANQNIIHQLGGKPALEQLQKLLLSLSHEEQLLVEQGLHIGIAVNAAKASLTRGDFLVRNVIGADQETGCLAVTDLIRAGQTIQFHVRDAASASEDLDILLARQSTQPPAEGALLFSCNGRGQRMFRKSNHDIDAIQRHLGVPATAGFFAAGEVGPIGGKNFLHGFTASIALFREKRR